jgi:hypothetical protein
MPMNLLCVLRTAMDEQKLRRNLSFPNFRSSLAVLLLFVLFYTQVVNIRCVLVTYDNHRFVGWMPFDACNWFLVTGESSEGLGRCIGRLEIAQIPYGEQAWTYIIFGDGEE